MKILKLTKAYIIVKTSGSMLLMFPFSLYFPLVYLQIFYVFFFEYLWDFAKTTTLHPKLHPSVSITK